MNRIRPHLTYANVVATLALFIALGGSSYAVSKISGSQIKDRTIAGKKLKRNTLGGTRIKESRLGTVRRARTAARLAGFPGGTRDSYTALDLQVICPPGTLPAANTCPEPATRAALSAGGAIDMCRDTGKEFGPGRRLPDFNELRALVGDGRFQLAPEGELTNNIYPTGPNQRDVLIMAPNGTTSTAPDSADGARPFRCVADPIN
jgi:hypothetical protein